MPASESLAASAAVSVPLAGPVSGHPECPGHTGTVTVPVAVPVQSRWVTARGASGTGTGQWQSGHWQWHSLVSDPTTGNTGRFSESCLQLEVQSSLICTGTQAATAAAAAPSRCHSLWHWQAGTVTGSGTGPLAVEMSLRAALAMLTGSSGWSVARASG